MEAVTSATCLSLSQTTAPLASGASVTSTLQPYPCHLLLLAQHAGLLTTVKGEFLKRIKEVRVQAVRAGQALECRKGLERPGHSVLPASDTEGGGDWPSRGEAGVGAAARTRARQVQTVSSRPERHRVESKLFINGP